MKLFNMENILRTGMIILSFVFVLALTGITDTWAEGKKIRATENGDLKKGPKTDKNGYPLGFDGAGRLEKILNDSVLINDMRIKLSKTVTFNTQTAKDVSRASFFPGAFVGYLMNPENEIISLWLLNNY